MQELMKQEKQLVFGSTLILISLIFGERKKSKSYIFKKVGLSTIKEILKKYVYNSTFMFFNILLFCLKGYSETLNSFLSHNHHFHSFPLRDQILLKKLSIVSAVRQMTFMFTEKKKRFRMFTRKGKLKIQLYNTCVL